MVFFLSILLICVAHCIRVYRWELFIETYEKPKIKNLFKALSIGYLFNAFLPMKLGDLVRMWISGKKMKNGRGFSLAIIIVERCLDILVVGFTFLVFYILKINNSSASLLFYIALSCFVLLFITFSLLLRGSIKRIIKNIASIFNENIEFRILKFLWALIWSFKDIIKRISKIKMLASTAFMWGAYIFSYYMFADFLTTKGLNVSWYNVFYALFAENSIYIGNLKTFSLNLSNNDILLFFALYIILPSVCLFVGSFLVRNKTNNDNDNSYLNLIPHLDKKERLEFLELYFSNDNREYVESYLEINQHIQIIRDYSAGSNATTMLCKDKDKVFFRKYAFGADGDKLFEQIKWIEKYSNVLTLTKITNFEKKYNYCYYDMPYDPKAETMFNFAHSSNFDTAWLTIKQVLDELNASIYKIDLRKSDSDTIGKYVASKVDKNIEKIENAEGYIADLVRFDYIYINGKKYPNLNYFKKFLNREHLLCVFRNDDYSVIHGDLTIENIIARSAENEEKNYYIIDPNTGNLHDSPFLDFAKLLQSIHGGYEFLMEQEDLSVEGNRISFPFKKSQVYYQLLEKYDSYLCSKFSEEDVKSIYYHEIIHWLRLMPYKINKIGKRAVLFYAGMLMVMNDVIERFESDEK